MYFKLLEITLWTVSKNVMQMIFNLRIFCILFCASICRFLIVQCFSTECLFTMCSSFCLYDSWVRFDPCMSIKTILLWMSMRLKRIACILVAVLTIRKHRSMVSCKKSPTCHAYAWQIGPFGWVPSRYASINNPMLLYSCVFIISNLCIIRSC